MKSHIKLVGVLHVCWNLLHVLGAFAALLVYFVGASAFGIAAAQAGEPEAGVTVASILAGLGLLGGCIVLAPSLPGFVAGWALLKHREWARWVLIVISILYLFHIGLGTALGIYSLWVLLHDETAHVLEHAT